MVFNGKLKIEWLSRNNYSSAMASLKNLMGKIDAFEG